MVSLKSVGERFHTPFEVIANGSGMFMATLSEAEQAAQPAFVFTKPRHVLRVKDPTALRPGMVVRSPQGDEFILGENGRADNRYGSLWQSFRVFQPDQAYSHTRRTKKINPVTKTEEEGKQLDLPDIYAAIEPLEREQTDREMRRYFEMSRFIAASEVTSDDFIDGRQVVKVDKQLGIWVGMLM